MNEWFVALNPIFFLGLLIFIGYFAERLGFVQNISERLSKLILHITLPLLVIISISEQDLGDSSLSEIFFIITMGIIAISALIAINYFVGKLLKIKK